MKKLIIYILLIFTCTYVLANFTEYTSAIPKPSKIDESEERQDAIVLFQAASRLIAMNSQGVQSHSSTGIIWELIIRPILYVIKKYLQMKVREFLSAVFIWLMTIVFSLMLSMHVQVELPQLPMPDINLELQLSPIDFGFGFGVDFNADLALAIGLNTDFALQLGFDPKLALELGFGAELGLDFKLGLDQELAFSVDAMTALKLSLDNQKRMKNKRNHIKMPLGNGKDDKALADAARNCGKPNQPSCTSISKTLSTADKNSGPFEEDKNNIKTKGENSKKSQKPGKPAHGAPCGIAGWPKCAPDDVTEDKSNAIAAAKIRALCTAGKGACPKKSNLNGGAPCGGRFPPCSSLLSLFAQANTRAGGGSFLNLLVQPIVSRSAALIIPSFRDQVMPTLISSLANSMTESLKIHVNRTVHRGVVRSLTTTLTQSLTHAVIRAVTPILKRSVSILSTEDTTQGLVPTLTHGLAYTITKSLHRKPRYDYFCHYCATNAAYCPLCVKQRTLDYYTDYYIHYYASYFSQYYTKLYSTTYADIFAKHMLGDTFNVYA